MSAGNISYALAAVLVCAGVADAQEIYHAIAFDDVKRVGQLLQDHPELLNTQDASGDTPLMAAAGGGHDELVQYLLDKNADYKIADRENRTALHLAVKSMAFYLTSMGVPAQMYGPMRDRYQHVLTLLLGKSADINAKDRIGYTPLQSVASEGEPGIGTPKEMYTPNDIARIAKSFSNRVDVADFLIAHGAEVDIFSATGLDEVKTVAGLLDRHPELASEYNSHGDTPLHWAARLDRVEAAKLLLDRGASVDATMLRSMTPLAEAALAGNRRVVELLLEKGADVNALSGGNRESPLYGAVGNGHADVVELLLAHGADIELKDGNGNTPLLVVASRADKYGIDLLLKHRANVNAVSRYGWTPLLETVASAERNVPAIAALLRAGADISVKSRQGKTALQYAEEHGDKDLIELLRQCGAKE